MLHVLHIKTKRLNDLLLRSFARPLSPVAVGSERCGSALEKRDPSTSGFLCLCILHARIIWPLGDAHGYHPPTGVILVG